MKKQIRKLALHRETLRTLDDLAPVVAARAAQADNPSFQSGETWCWCSNPCDLPWTAGPVETD
ncbi:MAG TPA: hypothetical protein VIE43_26765 [Thermoanaerobaculia bacterium]|jgi:hypothetical protein|nr:hypothetical protein [Thermoanaerobaculia bacterium]